jgi:hypothetical protein
MTISSVLRCFAADSWSSAFFVYDQEGWSLREDLLPPLQQRFELHPRLKLQQRLGLHSRPELQQKLNLQVSQIPTPAGAPPDDMGLDAGSRRKITGLRGCEDRVLRAPLKASDPRAW